MMYFKFFTFIKSLIYNNASATPEKISRYFLLQLRRNHPPNQHPWSHQLSSVLVLLFRAEKVSRALSKINTSRAVALAVSVNSPGGTPVQSLIIANKIQHFAQKHNLRVFTFASNLAASGGYFVLCAGNHVCADRTSIVGSIGVVFPKWNL